MKKLYKKALVTGGAGFIGSHISKKLIDKDLEVFVIDDLSTGKTGNIPAKVKFIKGDILDKKLVRDILTENRINIIFHEAARVTIRESMKEFYTDAETNIMGTVNIINSCRNTDVRKIVYASSMAVYADSQKPAPVSENHSLEPISPYGISKLAAEKYCLLMGEEMGISSIALRYFNTFGAGQQFTPYVGVMTIFINRILAGEAIEIFGDGEQRRDFIHVEDIAEANILAMESECKNGSFNIGTEKPTSVNELAKLVRVKMSDKNKIIYKEKQVGELRNSIADITKAKECLNFNPSRSLEETVDEVIEWNRKIHCG